MLDTTSPLLPALSTIGAAEGSLRLQMVMLLAALGVVTTAASHLPSGDTRGLAFALPFKFVNYQLVSIAFAHGKERQRLQAALVVAVMSVVLVTLAAGSGPTAVAGVTVLTEATLTAMLMIAARGPRFRRSVAAG